MPLTMGKRKIKHIHTHIRDLSNAEMILEKI